MNLVKDAAERIFWTFVQAFLGVLVVSPVFDNLGLGWEEALKVGVAAGVLAAAKVLLAIAVDQTSGGQLAPGASVEVKPDTP
jgi:ABC-type uncharacterized transport system permease subunit